MRWMTGAWREATIEAVGVLFPVECIGCGAADRALCARCREALAAAHGHVRLVAGVRADAAFVYTGLVRELLLALKMRDRTDLLAPLGVPTGRLVRRALIDVPGAIVLRIPSSEQGMRRRGFDPVELLLTKGGVRGSRPLRRARGASGESQKRRSAAERVTATIGTLTARAVAGHDVVLVDDVMTTGVTMAEGVRAIRSAGGRVVRCVVTASVEE